MVSPASSTLIQIRNKVRRLTACSSESSLPTSEIDFYINTFYNQDFPYGVKIDQMRSVFTFYTQPYIDRYPVDVNYWQGFRDPVYFEGIQGFFYKDRNQFFNMWPRWPTQFNPITGNGSTQSFTFTISATPFLRNEVTLGGVDISGAAISVADDGNGNLQYQSPNPIVSVPVQTSSAPGMKNLNTANPGQNVVTNIGTIDYVTGAGTIDFSLAPGGTVTPASGQQMTMWVSQYQTGRPYTCMFWNNYILVRPIPKLIHKVEIEAYQTPVQFMATGDVPILNQWWQLIAIGAAIKVLEDRQDMEGVENLVQLYNRQEGLVLERQGIEEIGQRNTTIFASTQQSQGWNNGWGGWFG